MPVLKKSILKLREMSSLKKNFLSNLLGQVALVLIGFIGFKYVYTSLGEDGLGIIYFSIMLSTLLSAALDLGLTRTTIRELAGYQNVDPGYVVKLLQTFSSFYWAVYAVLVVAFGLSLPLIVGSWVKLATMDPDLAKHALLIIGASSLLAIPKTFLSSICVGMQKMHVNNSINVVGSIVQQAGIIYLLSMGGNIITVAYWIAVTSVLNVFTYLFFVARMVSFDALIPKISMDVVKRIRKFTKKMAWISLLVIVYKQLDKLLMSMLLPIGVMGIYSFIYMMVTKISLVTDAITQAIFPVFSELECQNDKTKSQRRFFEIQDMLVYGLVALFALFIFVAMPVLTFLLDKTKAEMLLLPAFLLSVAFYLNGTLRMINVYVYAMGKPIYVLRDILLLLTVVSPITIIMIFKYEMVGAALSWVVSSTVSAGYLVSNIYVKELNKSVWVWLRPVLSAVMLTCITYLPAWIVANYFFTNDLLYLVPFYIAASLVYCALAINFSTGGFRNAFLKLVPGATILIVPSRRVYE